MVNVLMLISIVGFSIVYKNTCRLGACASTIFHRRTVDRELNRDGICIVKHICQLILIKNIDKNLYLYKHKININFLWVKYI